MANHCGCAILVRQRVEGASWEVMGVVIARVMVRARVKVKVRVRAVCLSVPERDRDMIRR